MLKGLGFDSNTSFFCDYRFYSAIIIAQPILLLGFLFITPTLNSRLNFVFIANQLYIAMVEEIIFRGILLSLIRDFIKFTYKNLSIANIITSIIFSLAHLITHPPLWAFLVFFPSLIFGYFKEKFNIYPSIILHFIYNFEYFLLFV